MMLSSDDICKVLGIGQHTILALAKIGSIPYKYISTAGEEILQFCIDAVIQCLKANPELKKLDDDNLETIRQRFLAEVPEAVRAIQEFDKKFRVRPPPKYYYLLLVTGKDGVETWYVKYAVNGRLIPSKWSTSTSGGNMGGRKSGKIT